ncbi:LuxR C-terminal-related transcriptional regulator [Streptomyces sp. NPDC018059]|uniref:LuxR C-terminal-related transcriptional regulator n=1 Tax=Streptomyces sp. NPDC018059 TaxID=3365041 RepID=UPI0037B82232
MALTAELDPDVVPMDLRGRTVLPPAVASRLVSRVRAPGDEPLSTREREVLALVARGTSNRAIAADAGASSAEPRRP